MLSCTTSTWFGPGRQQRLKHIDDQNTQLRSSDFDTQIPPANQFGASVWVIRGMDEVRGETTVVIPTCSSAYALIPLISCLFVHALPRRAYFSLLSSHLGLYVSDVVYLCFALDIHLFSCQ
ncbi:hypothetical protein BC826DRAFT_982758 [Russula brevipes]|nr:hypothetical protein BC826DRAFT_982758 [Russula brevipes]